MSHILYKAQKERPLTSKEIKTLKLPPGWIWCHALFDSREEAASLIDDWARQPGVEFETKILKRGGETPFYTVVLKSN